MKVIIELHLPDGEEANDVNVGRALGEAIMTDTLGYTVHTHIKQFREMLTSIGYNPKIVIERGKQGITLEGGRASNGARVHGYTGFVAHFEFNEDGSLDTVGIYE